MASESRARSGDRRAQCPVPRCQNRHDRSMLMCRGHWRSLPKPLRDELWRAYRHEGILSDAYQQAREACIAHASGDDLEVT